MEITFSASAKIFFIYILFPLVSILAPIVIVAGLIYPRRFQKFVNAKKLKFNPWIKYMQTEKYIVELRAIGIFGTIFFIIVGLLNIFDNGVWMRFIGWVQLTSLFSIYLFAIIFSDKFFGRYK